MTTIWTINVLVNLLKNLYLSSLNLSETELEVSNDNNESKCQYNKEPLCVFCHIRLLSPMHTEQRER